MNIIDITTFYSITRTKIKLIEEVRKYYGKETSPLFNSFDFWHIDENKVSKILAYFLDPNANHQQGDIYLKHFLKKYQIDFFYYSAIDQIKVECELRTDNNRRIDIVIIKNNFEQAIGIENKIYLGTADQSNQLSDYLSFLDKRTNNNYFLIYLSPKDKIIPEYSLTSQDREKVENEKKFKHLNYEEDIIDCIREFSLLSESLRVKAFLKDLEKTLIKKYIGEDNMDTKQIIKNYINEDINNLEISFLISNSLREVKLDLLNIFKNQITEISSELGIEQISDFKLKPTNWSKHHISFSYEGKGLIYGLTRNEPDPNKSRLLDIENLIEEKTGERFYVSHWWPMWQYFYDNVEKNEQFYKEIKTGRAKERAKEFIRSINENFNTNDY